jgi:hypothetical protein
VQAHHSEGVDGRRSATAQSEAGDAVLDWRFTQFRSLGFDEIQAVLLAHSTLDLHATRTLISRGCSPTLAVKIAL